MTDQQLVHATCVSVGGIGFLILGPSGSSKSDLALRLIDQPGRGLNGTDKTAQLVSDDQVVVRREGGGLIATPPDRIAGLLEVRGLGIMPVPHLAESRLSAAIRLVPQDEIERLPDPGTAFFKLLGIDLPMIEIDPKLPSAPARVRAAADWLAGAEPVASR